MNAKRLCIAAVATFLAASLAPAQEILPKPDEAFRDAKIGRTYKDSKPGTMALTKAPAGAPNVLIILIDDSGFGQWGTFGGQVPTPNLDRLAKMGLRYTRFHTTALCSPTRAALSMIGMHGETHIKEVGRIQRLLRRDQSEGFLRFDIVRYSFRSDNSIRGK